MDRLKDLEFRMHIVEHLLENVCRMLYPSEVNQQIDELMKKDIRKVMNGKSKSSKKKSAAKR